MGKLKLHGSISLLALALCAPLGCDGGGAEAPSSPRDRSGVPATGTSLGRVSLQLTLGGGTLRFAKVDYALSGRGLDKRGAIDVGSSPSISAVIDGIPFGLGYLATLTAKDLDGVVSSCQGSGTFDVTGSAPVPVSIHMVCKEALQVEPAAVPVPPFTKYLLALGLGALGAMKLGRRRARRDP